MYYGIHCSNSSPILELSVKFASQICHENVNKPLDGAYLADLGIDITFTHLLSKFATMQSIFSHNNPLLSSQLL